VGEQRLIDAMSTVTKISKKVQPFLRTGNSARELYDTILGCFAEAPTVDAVEVVRCKDCKHREHYDALLYCGHIRGLAGCVKPEYFCPYGERRTDGSEG
jgi:hypothetical protein